MDAELPAEAVCPLCVDETTTLKENSSGNPFFQCRTFDCVVNMRPNGREMAEEILNLSISAEEPAQVREVRAGVLDARDVMSGGDDDSETEVEQPEGKTSLKDLFGGGDGE